MPSLRDIVERLDTSEPDLTIYATEPRTCESQALLANEPDVERLPREAMAAGATYLIEVFVAKEFLDGWAAAEGRQLTAREKCNRLIDYAINDA